MFSRMVRRPGIVAAILIIAAGGYWWARPRGPKVISARYVGDRTVMLWNTLAQVRQPVAELHYGDRLDVLREEGANAQVRTSGGLQGWILDSRQLMDPELWQQSADLYSRARNMPAQARGQMKTVSNVRIEPGRGGRRVYQFLRGTPVVVFERAVRATSPAADDHAPPEKDAAESEKPKQEDWLLVMRDGAAVPAASPSVSSAQKLPANEAMVSATPVSGGPNPVPSDTTPSPCPEAPIAGWVLARFVEPELPGPVRDYASSADLHIVAWFVLNHVPDETNGEVPQFLVAGSRGAEGNPCDFTMLRVYTWGARRKRYETAYVEGGLCGHLPIRVAQSNGAPSFRFAENGANTAERLYIMQQTSVRRVRQDSPAAASRRRRSAR